MERSHLGYGPTGLDWHGDLCGTPAAASGGGGRHTDLYPILRQLRDSAWQWAKPLGGMGPDHVIALHNGLIDLVDLTPAIVDRTLAQRCRELLEHDLASVVLSIDPPRFHNLVGTDALVELFADFGQRAHQAVERCQRLRRGAA